MEESNARKQARANLIKALEEEEMIYKKRTVELRDFLDESCPPEKYDSFMSASWQIRGGAIFFGCLRRLVVTASYEEIHKAFGAPGDFGYETPVGDALSKFYHSPGKDPAPAP